MSGAWRGGEFGAVGVSGGEGGEGEEIAEDGRVFGE